MTQIHRTTFEVVVYSEGPLNLAFRDDDPFQLLAINYEINEGGCVGGVEEARDEIVEPKAIKDALIEIGNDGEFFDRADNEIDRQMVGYPDEKWYVFDDVGSLVCGPWEDENEAEDNRQDDMGEWVGQLTAGIVDISYAPENIH